MKVTVLTGGVGGAKLVLGLARSAREFDVTAIVNTGDDFCHLGLAIGPDIDTLLYTLSGRANERQGWGREGESWNFMAALRSLGGPGWFQLGDGDLALHVWRTQRLAAGELLSAITADIARTWGIASRILPMSDDPVRTMVLTDDGELDFQDYFVGRRCEPAVRSIRFTGAGQAAPAPGVLAAITDADAVLIAPSNPFLSIDPILAIPAIRAALADRPVVAVSPLVNGQAVKGPTAKLMGELGIEVSPAAVARHYDGLVDGWVIDSGDPPDAVAGPVYRTATLMVTLDDRIRVAEAAVGLARDLAR